MFEFKEMKNGCVIKGHSRSQAVSKEDGGRNFCNVWNVIDKLGKDHNLTVLRCGTEPEDYATTCANY